MCHSYQPHTHENNGPLPIAAHHHPIDGIRYSDFCVIICNVVAVSVELLFFFRLCRPFHPYRRQNRGKPLQFKQSRQPSHKQATAVAHGMKRKVNRKKIDVNLIKSRVIGMGMPTLFILFVFSFCVCLNPLRITIITTHTASIRHSPSLLGRFSS